MVLTRPRDITLATEPNRPRTSRQQAGKRCTPRWGWVMSDPRILADALDDYIDTTSLTDEEQRRIEAAYEVVHTHAVNGVGIECER